MVKTLALKELREIYWLALLALLIHAASIGDLMGFPLLGGDFEIPFAGPSFPVRFGLITGVLAIALGFRQSAWESVRGTYLFLLHRPLAIEQVFLTKLGAGLALSLVCGAAAILVFAFWCATPDHFAGPFLWPMTGQSWQILVLAPTLYLGAFLSGVLPARWFGARLLPLVGAAVLGVIAFLWVPWWTWAPMVVLLSDGVILAAILHVTKTRDYP